MGACDFGRDPILGPLEVELVNEIGVRARLSGVLDSEPRHRTDGGSRTRQPTSL